MFLDTVIYLFSFESEPVEFDISTTVSAPRESVFRVFSDFSKAAERIEGIESIEMLDEGPFQVGTRFRETRKMFGKETTEEMTVVELEGDRFYRVTADSCGTHFSTAFQFSDHPDGTEVKVSIETKPYSLFAKLMSPLGRLMAGSMKKMMCSDIDQLKAFCEAEATR